MKRVVFDCMVYLQAVTNPKGPAFASFTLADSGTIRVIASEETLAEVVDVLNRPRMRAKFPSLDDARRDQLLEVVRHLAEVVPAVPKLASLPRDPDDEPYLNLAIHANADFLVTRDKDLLDLMADAEFTAAYPRIRILDPGSLLEEFESERDRS